LSVTLKRSDETISSTEVRECYPTGHALTFTPGKATGLPAFSKTLKEALDIGSAFTCMA
jgi:hypothetical protein